VFYDPLLSKLVTWGTDRDQAVRRMQRALGEYTVRGVRTTVPFFRWLLAQDAFRQGDVHTAWLDEVLQRQGGTPFDAGEVSQMEVAAIAAVLAAQSQTAGARTAGARTAHRPHEVRTGGHGIRASRWVREGRREAFPDRRPCG
jgi:acetyl/propionyl-CoA carboxylase alpha subunit